MFCINLSYCSLYVICLSFRIGSYVIQCPSIHGVCVDLSDWSAAREAVEKLGEIDLLVNNAGLYFPHHFLDAAETEIDK